MDGKIKKKQKNYYAHIPWWPFIKLLINPKVRESRESS